ncbi:MAG: hypothetical protein HN549_03725, partial [Proteobacteria bacterium]|nr:hypothetical protein [Pseudomonadota bacterium]
MLKKKLVIFALVGLVAGCGFQLRGLVELGPILSKPWVTGQDNQLVVDLRMALKQSGVNPVKDAESATAIIDLATVQYTRKVISVDSNGTATG